MNMVGMVILQYVKVSIMRNHVHSKTKNSLILNLLMTFCRKVPNMNLTIVIWKAKNNQAPNGRAKKHLWN